jgi:ribose transport system permease protein
MGSGADPNAPERKFHVTSFATGETVSGEAQVRKIIGLLVLLAALIAAACFYESYAHETIRFLKTSNIRNLLPLIGFFGILSLGQALVIITGGIDLSIGSVVALVGILTAILLRDKGWPPYAAIPTTLALAALIGLWHGLMVSKARIQPFVVTLCGLFFYRGLARLIAQDSTRGFGMDFPFLRWLGSGFIPNVDNSFISVPFVIMIFIAIVLGAYLHLTAKGRHIFAVGASEDAAHFSGISVDGVKIMAYMLCGLISGVGGLLMAFNVNSLGPSDFGNSYELYAIAGVVLGGCSLRGGSGTVPGVVIGATLIVVLKNLVNIFQIPSQLEYVVIGGAILLGVLADEILTRRGSKRVAP